MTDKERLEDIKYRFMKYEYDYNLNGEDVEWLIEQAERVNELETTVDFYVSALRDADRRVQELEEENVILKATRAGNEEHIELLHKQNKRYREALEWYSENSPHGNIADEALEGEK